MDGDLGRDCDTVMGRARALSQCDSRERDGNFINPE